MTRLLLRPLGLRALSACFLIPVIIYIAFITVWGVLDKAGEAFEEAVKDMRGLLERIKGAWR